MEKSPEKYEQLGHPVEWVQYARELFDSSEILYKEKDSSFLTKTDSNGEIIIHKSAISRSYLLLIGFSIENLMKAYLVARNPHFLKDGKVDKSISSNHDLFELSKKLESFKFSNNEIELLKTLSEGIPYWMRYPIPKRFENITNEKVLSEITRDNFTTLFERMILDIYQNFNREQERWIDTELEQKIKNK